MNIYEQLNKINDTESLSEKYNVKNAKELKKLRESTVSRKYSDQVWTVVSKDDPQDAVFTGDKEECERFAKQQNSTPAARARDPRGGYYIVKQGADVLVMTESSSGKHDIVYEQNRIYDELVEKGYTKEEIKSIFRNLYIEAINNFEPARPKLKAAFPDLDI